MVCIYCHGKTSVVNSRHQKRENHIWRRRQCLSCYTVFTTEEAADLSGSIRVAKPAAHHQQTIEHFSRDKLFLSIHRSLGHHQDATEAAGALCDTIIAKITQKQPGALIQATFITETTLATLTLFDSAAAVSYSAYHSTRGR